MKKLLKVTIGAALALTLTASTAMAGECPPQEPPPAPGGCNGAPSGASVNVFVDGEHYSAFVVQDPSNCRPFPIRYYKKLATLEIRTGTVAPKADPDVWTVTYEVI